MSGARQWLASAARTQLGLGRALWSGVRGRTAADPDAVALPYNGIDRAVVWTIAALGVLETVIVHVLVSWPPLRWPLLVLGIYGVLGIVAFDLSLRQHPHLLRPGELMLRLGHFRTARVPLGDLVVARTHVRNEHQKTLEVDDGALALTFMGGTNVELRFSPATVVRADGRSHTVDRVSFSAADPAAVVALLRARVAGAER